MRLRIHCISVGMFVMGIVVMGLGTPTLSCRGSSAPDGRVSVGIAIPSYVHAVAWIARDKGFFAREGVRVNVEVMGGSAATMRSLMAETTHIGIAGGDAVIKANLAGADLVVIAGLVDRFYHRLITRPEIRTAEDLRGKTIGLAFLGGPQDMAVQYALRRFGLDYDRDVKVLNLGKEFNRMAALAKGDIHATTSQTPPSRLVELGFSVLADLPGWEVRFPYATVVVRRSYLRNHQQQIRQVLAALCQGIGFYKQNQPESLQIIAQNIRGSDTEAAAAERYRVSGPSLLSYPPVPSEAGFLMVLDFLDTPASASMKPTDLFDLSILDQLRRDGKCDGLDGPA